MEISEFIDKAVSGDTDSVDQLIRKVQPRLRAYILRCTLNADVADDILQETMLPDWAAQEPVLRPDYGIFALLEDNIASNTQLARQ